MRHIQLKRMTKIPVLVGMFLFKAFPFEVNQGLVLKCIEVENRRLERQLLSPTFVANEFLCHHADGAQYSVCHGHIRSSKAEWLIVIASICRNSNKSRAVVISLDYNSTDGLPNAGRLSLQGYLVGQSHPYRSVFFDFFATSSHYARVGAEGVILAVDCRPEL